MSIGTGQKTDNRVMFCRSVAVAHLVEQFNNDPKVKDLNLASAVERQKSCVL